MTTENMAVAKRLADEVWNMGHYGAINDLCVSNHVAHDPLALEVLGAEAFKQFVRSFRTAFPDLKMRVDDLAGAGDEVFLRWTCVGTNRGSLVGMPATHKKVTIGGMAVHRLLGGKIVETWHTWDVLSLLQQLGYLPPMETIARDAMGAQAG